MAAQKRGQGRPAAARRDVAQLDARCMGEHLHRHVHRSVNAGRAVLDLTRPLLGVRHKIRDRLPGRFAADHQHGRIGGEQRNRGEIAQFVHRRPAEQRIDFRHDRNARKGHHQGIAVRLGHGLGLHPHGPAGAGLVDDDHGLLELFLQGRSQTGAPPGRPPRPAGTERSPKSAERDRARPRGPDSAARPTIPMHHIASTDRNTRLDFIISSSSYLC